MKRKYIIPEITTIQVQPADMIAWSPQTSDGGSNGGGALAPRRQVINIIDASDDDLILIED